MIPFEQCLGTGVYGETTTCISFCFLHSAAFGGVVPSQGVG